MEPRILPSRRPNVYHIGQFLDRHSSPVELELFLDEEASHDHPHDEEDGEDCLHALKVQNFTGTIIVRRRRPHLLHRQHDNDEEEVEDIANGGAAISNNAREPPIAKETVSLTDSDLHMSEAGLMTATKGGEDKSSSSSSSSSSSELISSIQRLPAHGVETSFSSSLRFLDSRQQSKEGISATSNIDMILRSNSTTSESAAWTHATTRSSASPSSLKRWNILFQAERMRTKIPAVVKRERELFRKSFMSHRQQQDLHSPNSINSTSHLLPRRHRMMSPDTSSILDGERSGPPGTSASTQTTPHHCQQQQQHINSNNNSSLPPTRLHELCAESSVRLDELEEALQRDPHAAAVVDARGRTPLHILGDNDALFGDPAGKLVTTLFIRSLIAAYPVAITMLDEDDRMPFCALVEDWCIWVYEKHEDNIMSSKRKSQRSQQQQQQPASSSSAAQYMDNMASGIREGAHHLLERVTEELTHRVDILRALHPHDPQHSKQQQQHRLSKPAMSKSVLYCPRITLWEEVEFCLEMLSMVMDELGGKNGGLYTSSSGSNDQISRKDKRARAALAEHIVGVIPTILKTVLLIDDEGGSVRKRLLRSSLFRRLLLVPDSVGPWLTHMLHRKGVPSKRAVDYLVLVSHVTAEDYVGGFRTVLPDDEMEFEERKQQVYESLEKLESTVASLVVLETKDTERAAATAAVWHIMDKNLAKPFVVGLLLIDFVLHITLMLAVREDVGLNSGAGKHSSIERVPTSVALFICTHYLVRKIVEALSLLTLSFTVFQGHLANIWTIIDLATIVLTLIAISWHDSNPGEYRNGFNAFVVGLLWLKVLGFLKVVNKHMSTFIMSVTQILSDLKYFAVVLCVVVCQMGDMMSIAVSTKDDGQFCGNLDLEGDTDSTVEDFCNNEDRSDAYLRVYALLLGDFELDSYRATEGLAILFVIFTVIGVVILLNVLIAVISDSYERARIRSSKVFGIARVTFVAQNEALETFLRPGTNPLESIYDVNNPRNALVCASLTFRWLVLLTLIGTAMNAEIFLAGQAISSAKNANGWMYLVLSVLLALVLTVALWIVVIYAADQLVQSYAPESVKRFFHSCSTCSQWVVDLVASRLFGVRQTTTISSLGEGDELEEEWTGRLNHMEALVEKGVLRTQEHFRNELRALEKRLAEQQALLHSALS